MRSQLTKRRVGRGAAAAIALTVLGGCAISAGSSGTGGGSLDDVDPIVLKVALPYPETASVPAGVRAFTEAARNASKGKLDFEYYYNSTLIPSAELLPGLSSGIADIGVAVSSYAPDKLPDAAWIDQWVPSQTDWGFPQVTISQTLKTRFLIEDEIVREDMESQNVVPLWSLDFGPYLMLCVDAVNKPEDLAGRSVRVGGEPFTTEVKNLGMVPSFIPAPETYEALQREVIDCAYQPASSILTQGLLEVAKNLLLTDGTSSSGSAISINKTTWDGLTDEAKQILRESTVSALTTYAKETMDAHADLIAQAKSQKVAIHSDEELDNTLRENRQAQGEAAIAAYPPSIEDPDAVVDRFRDLAAEWDDLWRARVGLKPANSAKTEDIVKALEMGSEGVDWGAFEQAVSAFVEPVRQQ
ncbi:TRAP transporter substrate-binding protein DctP [Dietzia sp. CH92]|uniref:TRAP transporter substrate-binding protein DctP n=1 Tax=Dietzia sp. CH92 TaxID=3051823 RepID=UPI0028D854A9|nr:TRAP transporter substrate-binding protein DctP [Dietzia sp. CH92]